MYFDTVRQQLDNGLVLLICQNKNLPIVSVNAFVRVGKDQNPDGLAGLASITSRLLDEGTERYSAQKLSELIENVGGELISFSERELTGVCLQLNSKDLSLGIELLAEMVIRPTFPYDRFLLERRKVLNHIRSMDDDPETVASHILNRLIYNGSPLAEPVLGVPESLTRLRVSDLRKFHRCRYGPQNAILAIVGDLQPSTVIEMAMQNFSEWSNPALSLRRLSKFERQSKPMTELRSMPKEQSTIYIGHLGIERRNPDFYRLQVLDTILGGGPGFTSRIPKELRDNQGLAYSAYADLTGSSGIYPGRFAAYVCTSPENRARAHRELLLEIGKVIDHGVSEEELRMAKDFLTGSFVFEFQGNSSIARYLLAQELFDLKEDYADFYVDTIQAVTTEDVHRVARRYLDTVNYSTVIAGSV